LGTGCLTIESEVLRVHMAPRAASALALAVRLVLLFLLLLPLLLFRVVAAVEAAGGGAESAVMAGIMAGDTADDRALDAALGVDGRKRRERKRCDEKCGRCLHNYLCRLNGNQEPHSTNGVGTDPVPCRNKEVPGSTAAASELQFLDLHLAIETVKRLQRFPD
jgi:hypothetical protein